MSRSQGFTPIDDRLGQNSARSQYPYNQVSPKPANIESELVVDGSSLAKNVLFVCDTCNGALVPSSICRVCKKTFIRTCVKCGIQKKASLHTTCCDLLLLGTIIKKHHEGEYL